MPLFHTSKGFISACMAGKEPVVRSYFNWSGIPGCAGIVDADGNTSLIAAARGGLFSVVSDLIQYGSVDVNARNNDGETALFKATQYGQVETVKVLLAAGADPNIPDKQGRLPIDNAAAFANSEMAKMLLDARAAPDTPNKPLLTAASYGYAATALTLIAGGAKVDAYSGDYSTALHGAARCNNPDVIKALVDKGADINARTSYGQTPLQWAVDNNSVMAIETLLALGASPAIKNADGQTPLDCARNRGYEQPIRLLEAAEKAPQPAAAATPGPFVAPASADGGETWLLLAPNKVAHVGSYPPINRKITEIFNFASRERLIITENLKTGAETANPAEKFETLPDETVRAATEALSRLSPSDAPKKSFNL